MPSSALQAGASSGPGSRLKLPAYAKSLLSNRRRGFHPARVEVYFGDDWREASARAKREAAVFVRDGLRAVPYGDAWLTEVGVPMLAVRPREFAPGVMDWRALTAVRVSVVDGCRGLADVDGERWGLFYFLLGELSRWAAEVWYRESPDAVDETAEKLALQCGAFVAGEGTFTCPVWWPMEQQVKADRERRRAVWYRAEFGVV